MVRAGRTTNHISAPIMAANSSMAKRVRPVIDLSPLVHAMGRAMLAQPHDRLGDVLSHPQGRAGGRATPIVTRRAFYLVMALSTSELLDLAGAPRYPWGELRLIWRLRAERRLPAAVQALPEIRPVLARAA